MKPVITSLLGATLLFAAGAQADQPRPFTVERPSINTQPLRLPAERLRLPPVLCADPAAQQIDFQILRRTAPDPQFHAQVKISGLIKNIGTTAYRSTPSQQVAYLYEGSRVVAQQSFTVLKPGQETRVDFERHWYSASPAEGEFPPTYRLLISYDPDILLDDNPKNDDCHLTNNSVSRSGNAINQMMNGGS